MDVKRNGATAELKVEGSIGESTPLFSVPLAGVKELRLDMAGVSFINSIGVKNWILWTMRVPKTCEIRLFNCPFVIVNQASTVLGFMSPNMKIESFRMPWTCEACGYEEERTAVRGIDYQYPMADAPKKISLPQEQSCPKCKKGKLEPDFFIEKSFKFLD